MPRYVIGMRYDQAEKLERVLGGRIEIVESTGTLDEAYEVGGAVLSSLDAVREEDLAAVDERLRTSGPYYHAGGPTGQQAEAARAAWLCREAIRDRLAVQQRARRIEQLGAHTAEVFEALADEAARDGKVDLELVLDLMTGAWNTGRSPHHNREDR